MDCVNCTIILSPHTISAKHTHAHAHARAHSPSRVLLHKRSAKQNSTKFNSFDEWMCYCYYENILLALFTLCLAVQPSEYCRCCCCEAPATAIHFLIHSFVCSFALARTFSLLLIAFSRAVYCFRNITQISVCVYASKLLHCDVNITADMRGCASWADSDNRTRSDRSVIHPVRKGARASERARKHMCGAHRKRVEKGASTKEIPGSRAHLMSIAHI